MTYNVFSGTLNPTHSLTHFSSSLYPILFVDKYNCPKHSRPQLHIVAVARE